MNIVNIISLFDFKLGEFRSQLKAKRMIGAQLNKNFTSFKNTYLKW